MGSAFFRDHVPSEDAEVVVRLRRAGALIAGKANLHEFAFGGTTQNPHHGLGRNPWNVDAIPGGSSGGSGVSVAAGMCDVSLGTDTGGSIRIPAALNGVVGLKPDDGARAQHRLLPGQRAHDTIGPLARTVAEVAETHEVISGYDARDAWCGRHAGGSWANRSPRRRRPAHRRAGPLVLAGSTRKSNASCASRSPTCARSARRRRRSPCPMRSRRSSSCCRWSRPTPPRCTRPPGERPARFGADVLDRLRHGQALTGRAYADAMRFKQRWLRTLDQPSRGRRPPHADLPEHGAASQRHREDARDHPQGRRFTYAWSMAGTPALSVPCGLADNGLPVASSWSRRAGTTRACSRSARTTSGDLASPEATTLGGRSAGAPYGASKSLSCVGRRAVSRQGRPREPRRRAAGRRPCPCG